MLRISKQWDSQPQEAVGVDWSNPLAQGLVLLVAGGGGGRRNAVDGIAPSLTGNGLITGTSAGAGVDLNLTTTDRMTWALPSTVQTSATLLTVCMRRATNTVQAISLHSKSQASTNANYLEIASGSNRPVAGTAASGSFSTVEGTSFGFVQLSTPYVFAGRFLPTERSIFGGASLLNTSAVARSPLNADEVCIGSLYDDSSNAYAGVGNGVVMLGAAWSRALSDAEIAQVSSNPWSLFAPRSIWVPVSAAGGGYTLTADAGAYTLSGQSATITRSRALTASPGSYTLSGQAATITRNRALVASSGSYTLSGQAATITRNRALTASSGAYTLSGQAATITYTPGTGTTYTLTASAGAYTLSGQTASLLYGRLLVAGAGSYAVTGQDATITYTPAALPTVGRPASDTSNAGWTANTGSDLYAMLDEVTPDAGDYIVTTATGSICEMPLQTTAYPGTAAQKLSYRASSSTGNSVIVRLKNTGGATVRTETQVLTASDTLYEITLTSGEIAAITSGALSVQLESA